jgi:hypothetical protein
MIKIVYKKSKLEFNSFEEAKEFLGDQLLASVLMQIMTLSLESIELTNEAIKYGDTNDCKMLNVMIEHLKESLKEHKK